MDHILLQISSIADDFLNVARESIPVHTGTLSRVEPTFSRLILTPPTPHTVQSMLAELSMPTNTATLLSSLMAERLARLAEQCEDLYFGAWVKLQQIWRTLPQVSGFNGEKTLAGLRSFYSDRYKAEVERYIQLAASKYKHFNPPQEEIKPSFNHDYTPLLEAFFRENAFPTRSEKTVLAKKSGMSFRQIHVWFQNRRSRAKRGLCQNDRPSPSPSLPRSAVGPMRSPSYDFDSDVSTDLDLDSDSEDFPTIVSRPFKSTSLQSEDPFAFQRPAHAFPTPYPTPSEIDPFPCKLGDFSFPKPEWRRQPTHQAPQSEPSLDSVISAFGNLSLGQGKGSRGTNVLSPITVHPSPAPLPSLIRRLPRRQPTAPKGFAPYQRSSPSTLQAQSSPKKSPFPKRLPKSRPTPQKSLALSRSVSFGSESSLSSLPSLSYSSSACSSDTETPEPLPNKRKPLPFAVSSKNAVFTFGGTTPLPIVVS